MTRLPNLSARETVKALKRAGFEQLHQRGSHLHLRHPDTQRRLVVPMHPGDLPRPLLKQIIRQAGLTEADFRRLL